MTQHGAKDGLLQPLGPEHRRVTPGLAHPHHV
jgi:hypothetical protein